MTFLSFPTQITNENWSFPSWIIYVEFLFNYQRIVTNFNHWPIDFGVVTFHELWCHVIANIDISHTSVLMAWFLLSTIIDAILFCSVVLEGFKNLIKSNVLRNTENDKSVLLMSWYTRICHVWRSLLRISPRAIITIHPQVIVS